MKLSLAENIRSFRKQKKMTQEKLAEALGVTVGAVYKWESGLSQPELAMLVEIADFFDTSVDILIGYKMKDNRLEATLENLLQFCKNLDPAAMTEAEKALAKYPNSFRLVYACANGYLLYGVTKNDPALLRRALELLEQSIILLPQNTDPRINETTISGDMALALFWLDEREKGLELLKKNNVNGIFSCQIAILLSVFMDRQIEASEYLIEAFLGGISSVVNAISAYVFSFRSANDWKSAEEILTWGLGVVEGLKIKGDSDILDKILSVLYAMQAHVRAKLGQQEASRRSLQAAGEYALRFDTQPDYRLKTMRFIDRREQVMFFDIFGDTASGSAAKILQLLEDRELEKEWEELIGNEQRK